MPNALHPFTLAVDCGGGGIKASVLDADGTVTETLTSDVVLLATGADPRVLPGAEPDGERILDWRDVYDLDFTADPDHVLDRRLVLAAAVGMDALMAR